MPTHIENPTTLNIWKDGVTGSETEYPPGQIDKRSNLSRKEFLHEYVLRNRPVVITDSTKDWKAISKWTPAFFRERYASQRVPVFERKRSITVKDTVLLRDYIDEINSADSTRKAKYLFSLSIPETFPELLPDLEPRPTYWDPNWLDSKYLLPGLPNFKLRNITGLEMNIGGAGSPFPFLHYDDLWTHAFITQVHGRKAWALYTPDQTPLMYPSAEAETISDIPMDHDVSLVDFPLFAEAKPQRVIVEEGEMLYGPPGWWHTTRALTPSIAVVLSTANGPIWPLVTKSAFALAWRHPKWYLRPAAFPIAAYMTAFRALKSLTEPF